MDSFFIATTFVIALLAGLAALVHFTRHDSFAGPGTGHRERDELAPRAFGRAA